MSKIIPIHTFVHAMFCVNFCHRLFFFDETLSLYHISLVMESKISCDVSGFPLGLENLEKWEGIFSGNFVMYFEEFDKYYFLFFGNSVLFC